MDSLKQLHSSKLLEIHKVAILFYKSYYNNQFYIIANTESF